MRAIPHSHIVHAETFVDVRLCCLRRRRSQYLFHIINFSMSLLPPYFQGEGNPQHNGKFKYKNTVCYRIIKLYQTQ